MGTVELFPKARKSKNKGHSIKVRVKKCKGGLRHSCNTLRVVVIWNEVQEEMMEAQTIR